MSCSREVLPASRKGATARGSLRMANEGCGGVGFVARRARVKIGALVRGSCGVVKGAAACLCLSG